MSGGVSRRESLFTRARWLEVGRIAVVGAAAALFWAGVIHFPVLLAAIALGLYPLVREGLHDLVKERKIGTEIFITLATIIAIIGKEYVAAAILLTIILIAEFIAELNTDRARASIQSLIGSVPRTALVKRGDREEEVPIEAIRTGDVVVARAGEKIPVDGVVRGGQGSVDESPITGESIPRDKEAGAKVFAGTVVSSGALDIETEKVGTDTMFARIVALVESAEAQRAPVQRLADRVAAWLIPVVFVFLAVVYVVTRDIRLIVTLLIFTSPAELGLATPLVMIAAIARAARSGVLIKGGLHLEQLAKATVFAFDKTGTLTTGKPDVMSVEVFGTANENDVVRIAAAAERRSGHPLAEAVVAQARRANVEVPEVADFRDVPGRGVTALVDGQSVLVGNAAFLSENRIGIPRRKIEGETLMFVVAERRVIGAIHLADRVRPGAKESIALLKASGVQRVVMLTGDNAAIAERIGRELGVDQVRADLLPDQKVDVVRELQRDGSIVAMVGDGVNDAPALAAADVGVAMGAAGTEAALEAGDIALMTDDIGKIVVARAIAARAYRTIKENLIVGVGVVHVAGITAALLHFIGPIQAAILHLGPDILVFVNSIKLLRVRLPEVRTPRAI